MSRVEIDAWVIAEDGCQVRCDVVGDQIQLQFGTGRSALNVVMDEVVLGQVVTIGTAAQTRLDRIPAGDPVDFSVTGGVTGGVIEEADDSAPGGIAGSTGQARVG